MIETPLPNAPTEELTPAVAPSTGSPYTGGLRYAPGLDGLRALAVAGVFLYHANVSWMPGGFLGVDLFFVLSGYLITSLLLDEYRRYATISLRAFWVGRARRLLPAATLVVAICVVVGAIFLPGDFGRLRADGLASLLYVNNWHQVLASRSYFASFGRPSLLQHYWSLSVEEQFYLVWPLLMVIGLTRLGRLRLVLIALTIAVLSAVLMAILYHPGADPSRVYYGTDTRATPLMVGAIVAFVWPFMRLTNEVRPGAARIVDGVGICGLLVVLFAMTHWHDYNAFLYQGGFVIVAVAAVAAVAAAAHPASRLGRLLASRLLRWLGQRSYGIYLWHWPIMDLSRPGIDIHAATWLVIVGQAALTLVIAELSYRFVEMPVRRGVAQRRIRMWLAVRAPRERLAAVSGAAAAVIVPIAVIALLPATGSALPAQLRALQNIKAPPIPGAGPGSALTSPGRSRPSGAGAAGGAHGSVLATPPISGGVGLSLAGRASSGAGTAPLPRGSVLAVGASVMLAAAPELEHELGARVDAVVGRQPAAIIDRLDAYRRAGALPARVIVQIGDNGPIFHSDIVRLRRALTGVPDVVLVNVREATSWENEVNSELEQAVQRWPQAHIADWQAVSANPSLTYDGAHPDPAGARVYAHVVAQALAG